MDTCRDEICPMSHICNTTPCSSIKFLATVRAIIREEISKSQARKEADEAEMWAHYFGTDDSDDKNIASNVTPLRRKGIE